MVTQAINLKDASSCLGWVRSYGEFGKDRNHIVSLFHHFVVSALSLGLRSDVGCHPT